MPAWVAQVVQVAQVLRPHLLLRGPPCDSMPAEIVMAVAERPLPRQVQTPEVVVAANQ